MTLSTGQQHDVRQGIEQIRELERATCRRALQDLGVHPGLLTAEERRQLSDNGFVVLRNVLTRQQVDEITAVVDRIVAAAWRESGGELPGNRDPRCVIWDDEIVVKDLLNRGPLFDLAVTHPRVLAAITHVLGYHIRLCYVHVRSPQPGSGLQEWHLDILEAGYLPVHYFANSIWMLDDFTEDNGATRVIVGSHRSGLDPLEAVSDPFAPHPDQVYITGNAGDVLVFDGHLWHSGTTNNSQALRRGLFSAWVHRDHYQIDDQRKFVLPQTYARLPDAVRFLVDVHDHPVGRVAQRLLPGQGLPRQRLP